ncbi:hypothetical protein LCGC14_2324420 [marine sediment metagenome]|uniref:HNH nuclease domain-containing protein n=1 Tax=marine sediment metagenome TaxID=412755 RepID=A0A0F9FBM8_9ZZZZ
MGKSAIRECIDCHEERPNKGHGRCRSCYVRWRRQTDPEFRARTVASVKRWQQAPPDRHAQHERDRRKRLGSEYATRERRRGASETRKEWKRQYYATHKEYFARKQREYRQRNREKANARWAKWYAANPVKVKAKGLLADQRRRSRQRGLPATLTHGQWEAIKIAYGHKCAYCGRPSQRLTQDHVIPLSKDGGYIAENIVPACRSCNSRKGNRIPPSIPAKRLMI